MAHYLLRFDEIGPAERAAVGGKGANLGELSRMAGVRVPPGFCVTTDAFRHIVEPSPEIGRLHGQLARLRPDDHEGIRAASATIRNHIEAIAIPPDFTAAVEQALASVDADGAYAVRSSATAEDLPFASFAGQHDSFLNVAGAPEIVRHIRRCWASLYSDRAVTYRLRSGIADKSRMAVVVQQMVPAQVAGVLFTADPVNGNRKVTVIEAVAGLGEALVGGRTSADLVRVRDGIVADRTIASARPLLNDSQAATLAALGRRIEAHFGSPQDIEWCLAHDEFHVVQSRPITTLFPIPESGDDENHVYVSVGHQQMMTDPLKPLGISFWQMTTPRPMAVAGGRLFVDVTQTLATQGGRAALISTFHKSDPLIADALQLVADREFVRPRPDTGPAWTPPGTRGAPLPADSTIVRELIERSEATIAAAREEIRDKSGVALLDFIAQDITELRKVQFDPRGLQAIMTGMEAAWWLNDKLDAWLGERNVADTLSQSVANNVTSEMGLGLLDVADAIRPHPNVVAFLERTDRDDFLDALPSIPGGDEARAAIQAWLDRYGVRGPGEIDITRPRWSEHPAALLPVILGHARNFAPGESRRRFERGLRDADAKAQDILARLRALPDGKEKARQARTMIDRLRAFAGYREYPKYGMISRYFVYKQALMREADRLVDAGVLRDRDDIFFLTFEEMYDVARTGRVNHLLIDQRREVHEVHRALTPPRVLTSEGEAIVVGYRRGDLPPGSLVGLPVSSGVVEGRARVVLDMAGAHLAPGDILVTAYTDPSWTPLFVGIAALVTEVGGLMTHGAVVAREYGLPAVVGVVNATRLIRDGERIRVNGTAGYIEVLE